MPDRLVTLARFTMPFEAEAAKIRLEAEGIAVLLQGDIALGTFAGLGGVAGMISLEVPEKDLQRATEILQQYSDEIDNQDHEDDAPEDDDEESESAASQNIAAGAAPSHRVNVPSHPAHEEGEDFDDYDDEDSEAEEEDDYQLSLDALAARAWRASVLGLLICPPLLHFYSLWTLGRMARLPGELTPAGMRKLYLALAIDGVAIVAAAWLVKEIFLR